MSSLAAAPAQAEPELMFPSSLQRSTLQATPLWRLQPVLPHLLPQLCSSQSRNLSVMLRRHF